MYARRNGARARFKESQPCALRRARTPARATVQGGQACENADRRSKTRAPVRGKSTDRDRGSRCVFVMRLSRGISVAAFVVFAGVAVAGMAAGERIPVLSEAWEAVASAGLVPS